MNEVADQKIESNRESKLFLLFSSRFRFLGFYWDKSTTTSKELRWNHVHLWFMWKYPRLLEFSCEIYLEGLHMFTEKRKYVEGLDIFIAKKPFSYLRMLLNSNCIQVQVLCKLIILVFLYFWKILLCNDRKHGHLRIWRGNDPT